MNAASASSRSRRPAAKPDWKDFRDHLATADEQGRRQWIYARKPQGRFYQRRIYLSWLLLGILFAGPFIKINGNPLLMLNIVARRFSILGRIFWPQDMALLAIALLLYFTGIMIFTAAYGRLWCGWVCPQTLFMEMVFRRIEYGIEGDSRAQRALAAAPWTARKIGLKLAKHAIFFGLSFVISNLLLSYIIGIDQLLAIITDNPARHLYGAGLPAGLHRRLLRDLRPLPRTGLHVYLPLWPLPIDRPGRKHHRRRLRPQARRKTRHAGPHANRPPSAARPDAAIAWIAACAWPSARPASTSATASRWNVSIARPASTPATA